MDKFDSVDCAGLGIGGSFYFVSQVTQYKKQVRTHFNKVLELESKLSLFEQQSKSAPSHNPLPKTNSKQHPEQNPELIKLRKEIADSKDHIKQLKNELAQKERHALEIAADAERKYYSLQEENSKLIEQLKEADVRRTSSKPQELEAMTKQLENQKKLVEKYKLENQTYHTETNDLQNQLKLWKTRAHDGRKMYRLLKQKVEHWEDRITTQRDGIKALASYIFKEKGILPPSPGKKDLEADRFLALAWSALNQETPSELEASVSVKHTIPSEISTSRSSQDGPTPSHS